VTAHTTDRLGAASVAARTGELLHEQQLRIYTQTDRLFAGLLLTEWLAGIGAAVWLSPRTWMGQVSQTHLHVWAAVYLGGAIAVFPLALVLTRSGKASTRHIIAVAQMLMSGLLIQLTGGRIETHFHVFGSLAFLSFYRDWRVLVPATLIVAADHFLRGLYWPQSVFGILAAGQWRWAEHAGWVLFEDVFLIASCRRGFQEMQNVAERSAELEASEARYRAIMEQSAEGICLLDAATTEVIECNAASRYLLGFADTEPIDPRVFASLELSQRLANPVGSDSTTHECPRVRRDGCLVYLSMTFSRISYGAREVICVVLRDTTERQRTEEALRHSEERYALAALGANDGLWDWDIKSGNAYLSRRWKQMLGLDEHIGSNAAEWFDRIHADDRPEFDLALAAHLDGRTAYFEHEHRILHADGTYRWVLSRGVAVRSEHGEPSRMAGSQADVTDRHVIEEQLRHDALHDALTSLPNRALFSELLERAVRRARRHDGYSFAVLFVDLDRFKVINDSLGHLIGDQLLKGVAERLKACLRDGDVIARFGGDELTILVDELQGSDAVHDVAIRIQDALKTPFVFGRHEICVTASIGVAVGPADYDRGAELLRDADIAMYQAKMLGKNRHEVFDVAMHRRALARLTLETDLRHAIDRQEFVLHFQPIVSLASKAIVGVEALVRWQRPDGRCVLPIEFMAVAEETGLIVPLGTWGLQEACKQMAPLQREFPTSPPLSIAVNVATRQLKQPKFIEQVASIIRNAGLAPGTLHLEITESAMLDSSEAMLTKLRQLKELGIQLYLDDFGTGYSSLSYLHRFPLDVIKIDRSFINRIDARSGDDTLVAAIVTLGKKLGMGVIAEGVETAAQLRQLESNHCQLAQGFLFSPAVDAAGLRDLFRAASSADHMVPGAHGIRPVLTLRPTSDDQVAQAV